jgi:hypothetical protein
MHGNKLHGRRMHVALDDAGDQEHRAPYAPVRAPCRVGWASRATSLKGPIEQEGE